MKSKDKKKYIDKVCLSDVQMTKELEKSFDNIVKKLPYLEQACIRHLANGCTYGTVSKMLEVPIAYVKYQERKAIRHLRRPEYYYTLTLGEAKYKEMLENHTGSTRVVECEFSTKTANTIRRNGFEYMEELEAYVTKGGSEWFAYLTGLGKFGLSELTEYYRKRGG